MIAVQFPETLNSKLHDPQGRHKPQFSAERLYPFQALSLEFEVSILETLWQSGNWRAFSASIGTLWEDDFLGFVHCLYLGC